MNIRMNLIKEKFREFKIKERLGRIAPKLKVATSIVLVVAIILTSYGISTFAASINRVVDANKLRESSASEDINTKYYEEYKFVQEQILLLNNETSANETNETSNAPSSLVNGVENNNVIPENEAAIEDEVEEKKEVETETEIETEIETEPETETETNSARENDSEGSVSQANPETEGVAEKSTVSTTSPETEGVIEDSPVSSEKEAKVSTDSEITPVEEVIVLSAEERVRTSTISDAEVNKELYGDRAEFVATTSTLIKRLIGADRFDIVTTAQNFAAIADNQGSSEIFKSAEDDSSEDNSTMENSTEEKPIVGVVPTKEAQTVKEEARFKGTSETQDGVETKYTVDLDKYGDNYVLGAGSDILFSATDGIFKHYKDGHTSALFNVEKKYVDSEEYLAYYGEGEYVEPKKDSALFWGLFAAFVVVAVVCAVVAPYVLAMAWGATLAGTMLGIAWIALASGAALGAVTAVGCLIVAIVKEVQWKKKSDLKKEEVDKVRYTITFRDWNLPFLIDDTSNEEVKWIDHKYSKNNSKIGWTNHYQPTSGQISGLLSWFSEGSILASKNYSNYLEYVDYGVRSSHVVNFCNMPIVPSYWEAYKKIELLKQNLQNVQDSNGYLMTNIIGSNFEISGDKIIANSYYNSVSKKSLLHHITYDEKLINKVKEIYVGYLDDLPLWVDETHVVMVCKDGTRWKVDGKGRTNEATGEFISGTDDRDIFDHFETVVDSYRPALAHYCCDVPNSNGLKIYMSAMEDKIYILGTDKSKKIYMYEDAKNFFNLNYNLEADSKIIGFKDCTFTLNDLDFSYVKDLTGAFAGCSGKIIKNNWEFKEAPNCTRMFNQASFDVLSLNNFPFPSNAKEMFLDAKSNKVFVSENWDINADSSKAQNFAKGSNLVGQSGTKAKDYSDTSALAHIDLGTNRPGVLWGQKYVLHPGWYKHDSTVTADKITDITLSLYPNAAPTDYDETWILEDSSSVGDGNYLTCYRKGTHVTIYAPNHKDLITGIEDTSTPIVEASSKAAYLFSGIGEDDCFSNLTAINNISELSFASTYDFSHMFDGCEKLQNLDLSSVDATRTTNMQYMFNNCKAVTTLDLTGFDVTKVTNMSYMFNGCDHLQTLNLTKFKANVVADVKYMFNNCSSLQTLDVSNINTAKVIDMQYMFCNCKNLQTLDTSNFKTDNVENMKYMFYNCNKLQNLNLANANTTKVKDMQYMFYNCSNLQNINVTAFYTANAENMKYMFYNCSNLKSIDLSKVSTSKVTDMQYMFYRCSALEAVDLTGFDTTKVTNMQYMFSGCSNLQSIDLTKLETDNVLSLANMFEGCSTVKTLNLSKLNVSKVENFDNLFYGCEALTTIYVDSDIRSWTSGKSSIDMFYNCRKLIGGGGFIYDFYCVSGEYARVDYGGIKPGYFTCTDNAIYEKVKICIPANWYDNPYTARYNISTIKFYNSKVMEHNYGSFSWTYNNESYYGYTYNRNVAVHFAPQIDHVYLVGNYNASTHTYDHNLEQFFMNFERATTIDLSKVYIDGATSLSGMFYACKSLQNINLSTFDTKNVTDMAAMFRECESLTEIVFGDKFNTSKVTTMKLMFNNNYKLTSLDLSGFDTKNVKEMIHMFQNCKALTKLDLESFDTGKVTDASSMFDGCEALETIFVSNAFQFASTTIAALIFRNCYSIKGCAGTTYKSTEIGKSYAVVDGGKERPGYLTLIYVLHKDDILKNINSTNDVVYDVAFIGYPKTVNDVALNSSSLSGYTRTSGWEDKGVIEGTKGLKAYLGNKLYNSSTGKRHETVVIYRPNYGEIYLDSDASYLFKPSNSKNKISQISGLHYINTSNTTNMTGMFMNVGKGSDGYLSIADSSATLNEMDISTFDTRNVTSMNSMFRGSAYKIINFMDLDTGKVADTTYMFGEMSNLTTIKSKGFTNTATIKKSTNMFYNSTKLKGGYRTVYTAAHVDKLYARVDRKDESGYFTYEYAPYYILHKSWYDNDNNGVFTSDTINTVTFDSYPNPAPTDYDYSWVLTNSSGEYSDGRYLTCYRKGYNVTIYAPARLDVSGNVITTEPIIYAAPDSSYLFSHTDYNYRFTRLTTINNMEKLRLDKVTSVECMFRSSPIESVTLVGARVLTSMDQLFLNTDRIKHIKFIDFDTSNVTSMWGVFGSPNSYPVIETIEFGDKFNTSKITDFSSMFQNCRYLKALDLSMFDTSNGTRFDSMFESCQSLETLDVSSFDTSNADSIKRMFSGCYKLKELDLSSFNTSKITNFSYLFYDCIALTNLNVSSFNTANAENFTSMFSGCESLTALDLSNFVTNSVRDMDFMFYECKSLSTLNLSNFDTSSLGSMNAIFYHCESLTTLDISSFNTRSVSYMPALFRGCKSLTSINLSGFNTASVGNMSEMFKDCASLLTLDLSNFNTSSTTNMEAMFSGCTKITSINLSSFDTRRVMYMTSMFASCASLSEIDLTNFNTPNLTSTYKMFENSSNLKRIYASSQFTTTNVISDASMFDNCMALTGGYGTKYSEKKVADKTYAKIDNKNQEGYFTDKNDINDEPNSPLNPDGPMEMHIHKICGVSEGVDCGHRHTATYSFVPLSDSITDINDFLNAEGVYVGTSDYIYLTKDITLTGGEIKLTRDVVLCLNGHSLVGTFKDSSHTVYITNCKEDVSTISSSGVVFENSSAYVYGLKHNGNKNIEVTGDTALVNADKEGEYYFNNIEATKKDAGHALVSLDGTNGTYRLAITFDDVVMKDGVSSTDNTYYIDNTNGIVRFKNIKLNNLTDAYSFLKTNTATYFEGYIDINDGEFVSEKPVIDFDNSTANMILSSATVSITNNKVSGKSIISTNTLQTTSLVGSINISNNIISRLVGEDQYIINMTGSGLSFLYTALSVKDNKIVGATDGVARDIVAIRSGQTDLNLGKQPIYITNNKAYSDNIGTVGSTTQHMVGLLSSRTEGFLTLSSEFDLASRIDSIAFESQDGTGIISTYWGQVSDKTLAQAVFKVDRYKHSDLALYEDDLGRLSIIKGHFHMICGEKATTSNCDHSVPDHNGVGYVYEQLTRGVSNSDLANYFNGLGKYAGYSNFIALDRDVVLSSGTLTLARDLYICLNGHSLTGSFINATGNNYKVYITNCSDATGVIYSHADAFVTNAGIEVYGKKISEQNNISVEVDEAFALVSSGDKYTYAYNVNFNKLSKESLIEYDVAASLIRTDLRPDIRLENITLENSYGYGDAEAFVETDYENFIEFISPDIKDVEHAPMLVDAENSTLNFEGNGSIETYKTATSSIIKARRMEVSKHAFIAIKDNEMPLYDDVDESIIKTEELYVYGDFRVKNNKVVEQGYNSTKTLSAIHVNSIKVYDTTFEVTGNRAYTSTMALSTDNHMYGIYSTITDNYASLFELDTTTAGIMFSNNSRFDSIAFASTTGEGVIIKDWTSTTAVSENLYSTIFKADTYRDNELIVKKNASNDIIIDKDPVAANLQFRATIYANGGSFTQGAQVKEEDVRLGSDIRGFEIPRRDGYKFMGFELATASTFEQLGESWPYADSAAVYASWSNITFRVRYMGNGATEGYIPDKVIEYGKRTRPSSNTFKKPGYNFDGWTTADGRSVRVSEDISRISKVDGDIVYLKANWRAIGPVTINYVGNDSSITETLTDTVSYGNNHTLRVAPFYRPGYTFKGWSLAPSGDIAFADGAMMYNDDIEKRGNITLYAQWIHNDVKDRMYYVIHGNDGQVAYAPEMTLYLNERGEIRLPKLERRGYEFTGFTTDREGNNPYTVPKWPDFEGRKDIYAQWRVKSYDVVYHSNNGEYKLATESKTHDSKVTVMGNNYSWTKPGHAFDGWSSESKVDADIYSPNVQYDDLTSGDRIDLYARWKKLSATIHYNSNGGTGNMLDETLTYGNADILSANNFERPSYVFSGWSTNSGDTTPMYIDGSDVDKILLDNSSKTNITLYAIWTAEVNAVKVLYDPHDGYIGNSSKARLVKVPNGSNFVKVEAKKRGYNQLNYTDGVGTAVTKDTVISGDTVVTANWVEKTYKVLYDGRGGVPTSLISGGTHRWSDPFDISTSMFTRAGYDLLGFDTEPIADNARYSTTARDLSMLTEEDEIRLYAVWKGKTYYIRYNSNGGTGSIENSKFNYGVKIVISNNDFTKAGYATQKFRYTNSSNETMYFGSGEIVDSSVFDIPASGYVDLYAEYQKKTSLVTVSTEEGTFNDGSKEYEVVYAIGDAVALEEPKSGNQIFKGYGSLSDNEGKPITADDEWGNETPTARYANSTWGKNGYTVYFINDRTGDKKEVAVESPNDTVDIASMSNTIKDEGFIGWSSDGHFYSKDAEVSDLGSIFGDEVYLYTVWEEKDEPYTLELGVEQLSLFPGEPSHMDYFYFENLHKDSKLNIKANDYIEAGTRIISALKGYEPWGWFNDEGKMEYPMDFALTRDDTRKATESFTFKYIYSNNIKYHITYRGNRGSVAGQNMITIPCTVASGPVEPVAYYQGAVFDHWFNQTTGRAADFDQIAREQKDVTLVAMWRLQDPLSFEFKPIPGSIDSVKGTTTNYAERFSFLLDPTERYGPTVPNKHFKYWSNTPDGRGDKYYTTDRFEKIILAGYKYIRLFAIWEGDEINISYHANGGLRVATPQVCHYDSGDRLKRNNFIKPGYVFGGWSTSSASDAKVDYYDKASVDDLYARGEDHTKEIKLYAVWIPESESAQVTYKGNEGKIYGQSTYAINVKKGDKFTALSASKAGSACIGYKDANGVDCTADSVISGDIKVFAQWGSAPKEPEVVTPTPLPVIENNNNSSMLKEADNELEPVVTEKTPATLPENSNFGSRLSSGGSTSSGGGSNSGGTLAKSAMPYMNDKAELTNGSWMYDPISNTWSYQVQNEGKVELAKNGWYHITNLAGENLWYKFNEYGIMEIGVVEDASGSYYFDDNPVNPGYGSLKTFNVN